MVFVYDKSVVYIRYHVTCDLLKAPIWHVCIIYDETVVYIRHHITCDLLKAPIYEYDLTCMYYILTFLPTKRCIYWKFDLILHRKFWLITLWTPWLSCEILDYLVKPLVILWNPWLHCETLGYLVKSLITLWNHW